MNNENQSSRRDNLFRTILRDVHFWIPLAVLIVGLLFLRELH